MPSVSKRTAGGRRNPVRERIVQSAFATFSERGYAAATTLEIAKRARVSKRELYALVGNKHEMLLAGIRERGGRLDLSAELPVPNDRESLVRLLTSFGTNLMREVSDPGVVSTFRLAIAEALRAPEVAQALDSIGREARRSGLRTIMARAKAAGLLSGDPDALGEQFFGLLWGDLQVSLLLGVAKRPAARDIAKRARAAAAAFLRIHPATRSRCSGETHSLT